MKLLRCFLMLLLALLPLGEAQAASGYVQITVKDQAGNTDNFNVLSSTGILSGNLNWANVICDQSAGTTCASVGTAGSPSTNALTVQPVTLGNGTSGNAARVTISNDSTGVVAATQSGTWNVTNISGTVSLPTGAATSANQTSNGTTLSSILTAVQAGTFQDNTAFTQGTSSDIAMGCLTKSSYTAGTSGNIIIAQCDTSGRQIVAGAGTAGTAAGGVLTVQGVASMTPLQVGGTVATNVAITANPLNLGAQAVSSENTAVTTSRQVQLVADLVGKLITLPYANPENFVSGATAAMTGTTSTSLIAAPASGLRNYVTHLICTNSHATVGTFVLVQDGSGGTTIYEGYAAAVGGGFSINFPAPLRQPTTATALFVQDVTTGANVICSGSGYKGA